VLAKQPTAQLRVYTIWMVGLGNERRSNWNPDVMPDPRVLHFWDAGRFVGPWFAKTVNGQAGYMWDAYLLYGPNATWDQTPGSLLGTGGTIIDVSAELRDKLAPLLKE
jgi:hypothetical protein